MTGQSHIGRATEELTHWGDRYAAITTDWRSETTTPAPVAGQTPEYWLRGTTFPAFPTNHIEMHFQTASMANAKGNLKAPESALQNRWSAFAVTKLLAGITVITVAVAKYVATRCINWPSHHHIRFKAVRHTRSLKWQCYDTTVRGFYISLWF